MAYIVYGETRIERPQLQNIDVENVYDPEGRIVEAMNIQISLTGWVYAYEYTGSGDSISPGVQKTSVAAKQKSLSNILAALSAPRKDFVWYERDAVLMTFTSAAQGHAGRALVSDSGRTSESRASSTVTYLGQDIDYGPRPQVRVVKQWAVGIFLIEFRLFVKTSPEVSVGRGDSLGLGNFLTGRSSREDAKMLSHTASVSYSIDQNHYTVRTVQGRMKFLAEEDYDADKFRADVYSGAILNFGEDGRNPFTKGVSLPDGFVREAAEYMIPPKRHELHYTIIDREVYVIPPNPATRITAQLEVKAQGLSLLTFTKRLTGTIEGNRKTTKTELLTAVIELLERHIMTMPLVFVQEASLIDFLYENRIAFDFHATQSPGLFFSTFAEAGIFVPPPSQNKHFMQDLRGTGGLGGSAYNLESEAGEQVPPDVSETVQLEREEDTQTVVEEYLRRERQNEEPEPGLISHSERVSVLVSRREEYIPSNRVNADGSIAYGGGARAQNNQARVFILVTGTKVRIANTPIAPNPRTEWNGTESNIAALEAAYDPIDVAGYQSWLRAHGPVGIPTRATNIQMRPAVRSRLGGHDVYEMQYDYTVELHPVAAAYLLYILNQDRDNDGTADLEMFQWPSTVDGVKDAVKNLYIQDGANRGASE